jgi:hypothetical protein
MPVHSLSSGCEIAPFFCSLHGNFNPQHDGSIPMSVHASTDSKVMCMLNSTSETQDEDSMLMCLSNSQEVDSMSMCQSNSHCDAVMMGPLR